MIDWNRKYGEVGYNVFGIKYSQDGKLYNLQGKEVDSQGRVIKTFPDWADPALFDEYEPEFPEVAVAEMTIDEVRAELDKREIPWHKNAKLDTLKRRLEDAR